MALRWWLAACVLFISCGIRPRPDPRAQILSERIVAFISQVQVAKLQGKELGASLTPDQTQKAKEYAALTTGAAKQAFLDSLTASQRSEFVNLGLMWQQLDARKKGLAADIATYLQEVKQEKAPATQEQANDLATFLMLYQLAQPPY